MAVRGIDYAWGKPTPPDPRKIVAAGYSFACRYLSRDPTKNISAAEALGLLQAGVDIVLVWETTAGRALDGQRAGLDDGAQAVAEADAVGAPRHAPIYYAVDQAVAPPQLAAVAAYQAGFTAAIAPRPVGVYGSIDVVEAMKARGARYGWQTIAWSRGQVSPIADLLQERVDAGKIDGVSYDLDRALADDYGGWRSSFAKPAPLTTEEDDMRAIDIEDPTSGGVWWVRVADGSVYTDGAAPYLGGLNEHKDWSGAGTATLPVAGARLWKDENGDWGYVIVCEDATGLHPYHFDRAGTYARPSG